MLIKKSTFLVFVLTFIFAAVNLSAQATVDIKKSTEIVRIGGKEYYIHVVEKGHTLYSIARVYGIPMDEIIFENPLAKDVIQIGQELRIPLKSREEEVEKQLQQDPDEFFYHVVKSGENMREIASQYKISYSDLNRANTGLSDPLRVGQYVKIPVSKTKIEKQVPQITSPRSEKEEKRIEQAPAEKIPDNAYIVKTGDNLFRIALNHDRSIEELKEVNPGLTANLKIGQQIIIPDKKQKKAFFMHKIGRRTKLDKLAREFNVNVEHLKALNPDIKTRLKPGQVVKIPLGWETEKEKQIAEAVPQKEEVKTPLVERKYPPAVEEEKKTDVFDLVKEKVINQDSLNCWNLAANQSDSLNIALMIPFFLDKVDSLKITEETDIESFLNEPSFRFIPFYYGTKMAVDSLNALGNHIKLTVYDISNSTSEMIKVLNDPSFRDQDLIIAPVYKRMFDYISGAAKMLKIPIVNPFSTRSEIVTDNPYVFKCQPTDEYNYEMIRNLVATYFTDAKIFFVKHHKQLTERDFPKYTAEIRDLLDSGYYIQNEDIYDMIIEKSLADTTTVVASGFDYLELPEEMFHDSLVVVEDELLGSIRIEGKRILTDTIEFNMYDSTFIPNRIVPFYYSQDSIYVFEENASIYRENVVFTFTDDNVFALNLMSELNIFRDSLSTTVIGIPNWIDFEKMDYETLSNLNVHSFASDFVNYQSLETNDFIYRFRHKFKTEPTSLAFSGFDFSWYFLNAMLNFGKNFKECLPYFSPWHIQTELKFVENGKNNGMENVHWKILKYNRFRLQEVPVFPPVKEESKEP